MGESKLKAISPGNLEKGTSLGSSDEEAAQNQLARQRARFQALEAEKNQLAEELAIANEKAASVEDILVEKAKIEKESQALAAQLAEAIQTNSEIPKLKQKIEDALNLVEERESLEEQIQSLIRERDEINQNLVEIKSALDKQTSERQSAISERDQAIAQLQKTRDNLIDQLQELRADDLRQKLQVDQLTHEVAALARQLTEADSRLGVWESDDTIDFAKFGTLLSDASNAKDKSEAFHRLTELLQNEYAALEKIESSRSSSGDLAFKVNELTSVFFEPYRPLSLLDVAQNEIGLTAMMLIGIEKIRRDLLAYLVEGGIEPIRPIPGVTRFDPSLHDDIPNLRRATKRKELADIVCQRTDVGILETDENGKKTVVKKAQVGRYVYEP